MVYRNLRNPQTIAGGLVENRKFQARCAAHLSLAVASLRLSCVWRSNNKATRREGERWKFRPLRVASANAFDARFGEISERAAYASTIRFFDCSRVRQGRSALCDRERLSRGQPARQLSAARGNLRPRVCEADRGDAKRRVSPGL